MTLNFTAAANKLVPTCKSIRGHLWNENAVRMETVCLRCDRRVTARDYMVLAKHGLCMTREDLHMPPLPSQAPTVPRSAPIVADIYQPTTVVYTSSTTATHLIPSWKYVW